MIECTIDYTKLTMARNHHGLQLAQTKFPDYFSEPIKSGNQTDSDFIRVNNLVSLASCAKKNEKQHKATFQEIFEWFQREYGLPQVKALTENETNGNKMGNEKGKGKRTEISKLGNEKWKMTENEMSGNKMGKENGKGKRTEVPKLEPSYH